MKLISWNLAARSGRIARQVAAIAERNPDVVALQEVTDGMIGPLTRALADAGLANAIHSFALAPPDFIPRGPRRYGQLTASRYALEPLSPARLEVPWPERVLTVVVHAAGARPVELYNTHIPPGSSNGWIKIEMLEGLYAGLAHHATAPRILCGDFNTPREERPDGTVVTWGQRIKGDGTAVVYATIRGQPGHRWDEAERRVLTGLGAFGLPDSFRALHGYGVAAFSWVARRGTAIAPRRFDHVFASPVLGVRSCEYVHEWREHGLSDHSAIETTFDDGRHEDRE
jgi:endonuclease/exonuclease/phosphatase family metal-dependent hydrolase